MALSSASAWELRKTWGQGQLALPVTVFAEESPGHFRSQVEPPPHESEQEPVQVTWHVELSVHETDPDFPTLTAHTEPSQLTLPLSPLVSWQLDPPLHSPLHDPAHDPVQVLPPVHVSEQEPPVAEHPVDAAPCQLQLPL